MHFTHKENICSQRPLQTAESALTSWGQLCLGGTSMSYISHLNPVFTVLRLHPLLAFIREGQNEQDNGQLVKTKHKNRFLFWVLREEFLLSLNNKETTTNQEATKGKLCTLEFLRTTVRDIVIRRPMRELHFSGLTGRPGYVWTVSRGVASSIPHEWRRTHSVDLYTASCFLFFASLWLPWTQRCACFVSGSWTLTWCRRSSWTTRTTGSTSRTRPRTRCCPPTWTAPTSPTSGRKCRRQSSSSSRAWSVSAKEKCCSSGLWRCYGAREFPIGSHSVKWGPRRSVCSRTNNVKVWAVLVACLKIPIGHQCFWRIHQGHMMGLYRRHVPNQEISENIYNERLGGLSGLSTLNQSPFLTARSQCDGILGMGGFSNVGIEGKNRQLWGEPMTIALVFLTARSLCDETAWLWLF